MSRALPIALIALAGIAALVSGLRGREYALLHLQHDRDGLVLEAPPDAQGIARHGNVSLDYNVKFRYGVDIPVPTGRDSGLADIRADIRWVRNLLSVGDDFHADTWWLRDIVQAAATGRRRFMCDTYSRALVNASLRQGKPARLVLLAGHISTEFWVESLHRWVFADALYDFIAADPQGRPLSVLEVSRRLQRGEGVKWTRVTGAKGDDDELDERNRVRLEDMLRTGFVVCDGPFAFGRLSRLDRARDLLLGRVHAVEYSPPGQPFEDRDERALRMILVLWCVLATGLAWWMGRRGSRPAPIPTA